MSLLEIYRAEYNYWKNILDNNPKNRLLKVYAIKSCSNCAAKINKILRFGLESSILKKKQMALANS